MEPIAVPASVERLAEGVGARGGRLYLVGGGVRDHLLGGVVKDWDLEVFGVEVDVLRGLLAERGRVKDVGRAFGVLKWRPRGSDAELDVSIPRRDSKVGPGHKGIAVEGDPTMSLAEATRRRDLTINAMMWDVASQALVDPQGGAADLQAGVLRAVDPATFLEDPLRALRVVQFVGRFGFAPDARLVACCREAALGELPAERILGEWEKLLLRGRWLARAFAVARETEILARVFPEVAGLDAGALDALATLRDRTEPEGRRLALMLLGWLGAADAAAVVATLDRLGLHTHGGYRVRERLLAAHAAAAAPATSDRDLRWLATRAEPWLVLGVRGDALALARAEQLGAATDAPARLLLGRHLAALGVKPGPAMGAELDAAYAAQLDGDLTTEADALRWATARRPS